MARMAVEMPDDEYKYLKLCCVKLGVSLKDFVTKSVIERVDLWEDEWMIERMKKEGTWNRKYHREIKSGKMLMIYDDGTEEELISMEDFMKELETEEASNDV